MPRFLPAILAAAAALSPAAAAAQAPNDQAPFWTAPVSDRELGMSVGQYG